MGDPVTTAGLGGGSSLGISQPLSGLLSPALLPRQPLPKQLTAAIKTCTSLERLVQLFEAHQTVLNPIHVAAIITKLPKLDITQATSVVAGSDAGWMLPSASVQQLQLTQLLQQLLESLKLQGCNDHSPRGVANIVWALAKLQCAPDAELRAMLLDRFCAQLSSAVPQDISNVLWGVAKLTKEHAPVLSTSLQQGDPAMSLQGQSSSSQPAASTGASDTSAAAAPMLQQQQLQLLLQHLCQQLHTASIQTISNSLWAVVVLQQEHQWCMCGCQTEIQTLLSMFCQHLQQAMPGHIQPIVRCMAQLATACSSHAGDSWLHWQPPLLQRLLDYLSTQREQLEMHHVSSVLRDVAQIMCLHLQHSKQVQDKQQARRSEPLSTTAYSSASSLPSVSVAGVSHSSSTASSSSMLGVSPVAASAAASSAPLSGREDAEEVLARLAAAGGPQDASSTVLALAMLRPQLQQLGLQTGVASLCSLLPPAALPHLGPEIGPRLLAAATYSDAGSACSPTAAVMPGQLGSTEDCAGAATLPVSSVLAARIFAQSGEGLPVVPVPLAVPGSLGSSSTSGSSVASPTEPSPIAASCAAASLTAAGMFQAQLPHRDGTGVGVSSSTAMAGAGLPGLSGHSNPGHSSPGHSSLVHVGPVGSSQHPGGTAAPAGAASGATVPGGGEAEEGAAGDTQEEAAARQLTHNIAYADSVFQLADIFTAHASVMDMIHITACITRLSKVLGTSPSQAAQAAAASLLPLLGNKLLAVLPNANARGIANVLWGYGRLRSLPQLQLLAPLVEAFLKQLPNAACRDSAVVLWSLARLSEGHVDPAEVTLQPPLLRRLGREVLQQLATAAQDSVVQSSSHQQQRQQGPSTPGGSGMEQKREGEGQEGTEAPGLLSSRDVSNSLMALARLGFVPEDDSAAAPSSSAGARAPGATTQGSGQQRTEQSTPLAAQMQGLTLGAPSSAATPAGAEGSLAQLTLPLSQIKAVVDYLLRMAATAKTLDLQETATALKQLGLRELHAKVAAMVITQHGSAHGGTAGHGGLHGTQGMQYTQLGGRMGQLHGRHAGGPQGHFSRGVGMPGSQFTSLMQQQRHQQAQMPASGPLYGQGWVPVQAGGGGQFEGGGMPRQMGAAGYMGTRSAAAGQHQQQAYVLSMSPAAPMPTAGTRPGMSGLQTLGGVTGMAYGGAPGAGASPGTGGYSLQYPGEQPQPPGLLQQEVAPSVQYMLLPQQGVGVYAVQQQAPQQQQQGEFLGMPVMQQQAPGDQAPPGLVAAGASGQPQYYMQATSAAALGMPSNMGVVQDSGGQQLFLQQGQAMSGSGLGALGQFGGAGVYQVSTAMMMPQEYVPDTMTSSAYTPTVAGDIFLGAQQPQQQGQRPQLQLLQRQLGQPVGLYQQQPQQQQQLGPGGFVAAESGPVYLQQPQQQQQLPVLYGMPPQGQQQQQQLAAPQGGAGTFVLDPASGMYVFQQ